MNSRKGWYQQTRHVLGSDANLKLGDIEISYADTVFRRLWRAIENFENTFSRFRIDSELSHVNAQAGNWTHVSSEFLELIANCQKYNQITHELFNPFILPSLQQSGYKGSWPLTTKHDIRLDVGSRKIMPISALKINGNLINIPAESALDFGGIGKGYMLDQLAEMLSEMDVKNYCLSLGGDIIYQGLNDNGSYWPIIITDSLQNDKVMKTIANSSGHRIAVATSGVVRRSGPGWNHLIDPRTNRSTETRLLKATVISSIGITSDIYAKTYILDQEIGLHLPGILGLFEQRIDGSSSVVIDHDNYFL